MKSMNILRSAGVLLILTGVLLAALSVFYIASYDSVQGELYVTKRNKKQTAYITYEYDGRIYEDVALSYHNAFTMKNGKQCTVYISSDKPDEPETTMFGLSAFVALVGAFAFKACGKKSEDDM